MSNRKSEEYADPLDLSPLDVTWAYLRKLASVLVVYLILHFFWPKDVLTSFHVLLGKGLVWSGLGRVWFVFVWAGVLTLLGSLRNRKTAYESRAALVGKGLWLSANAGFFEEVIWRVLLFLSAMITLRFLNWISYQLLRIFTLGHVHFNIVQWFFIHAFVPLANWATFHALQPQLLNPVSWVFGAAIVSACASFRNEHKHLGTFGWINAWFMGMVLFWLMFNYGLLTAIVAHFVYDAIVFTIRSVTAKKPSRLATAFANALMGGLLRSQMRR